MIRLMSCQPSLAASTPHNSMAVARAWRPSVKQSLSYVLPLSVLFLYGCAAQLAYREGRDLADQGQGTAALAKFVEARQLDSWNAQYRMTALLSRESLVNVALVEAEQARLANQMTDSSLAFNRALALQPGNTKALDGLKGLDDEKRHAKWLGTAQAALNKKDPKDANLWLRMILLENPQHREALALIKIIDSDSPKIPSLQANALANAYRKPITIEFKDAQLKTIFEVLSRTSGLNFVFDKDLRTDQKTSIFLKNSTIESALNLVLLTNQLEQRTLDANTVLIYQSTLAKQKDYQPLMIKSFYLANAEAKNVASTLKSLLKTRDVVVDDKLNLLIVRDSPEAIRLAEKLVALHDVRDSEGRQAFM